MVEGTAAPSSSAPPPSSRASRGATLRRGLKPHQAASSRRPRSRVNPPSRVRPSTDRLCWFSNASCRRPSLAAPAGTRTVTGRRFRSTLPSTYLI